MNKKHIRWIFGSCRTTSDIEQIDLSGFLGKQNILNRQPLKSVVIKKLDKKYGNKKEADIVQT